MILEINKEQAMILRDLLSEEARYLDEDAIPSEELIDSELSKKDVNGLKNALKETNDLLSKVLIVLSKWCKL